MVISKVKCRTCVMFFIASLPGCWIRKDVPLELTDFMSFNEPVSVHPSPRTWKCKTTCGTQPTLCTSQRLSHSVAEMYRYARAINAEDRFPTVT